VFEDIPDKQAQWNFTQILEAVLGGVWDPGHPSWDIRREAMLDALTKARPFAMTAALQINQGDARLFIGRSVKRPVELRERPSRPTR
jgi:hypothetical protein